MQPEVVETPVAEAPDFSTYEARRTEQLNAPSNAADDFESEGSEETPEPAAESAPAEPATETPPEPAAESGTVEEKPTETPKEPAKKDSAIPQSRLDEVTKARREAERLAATEKQRADDLQKQIDDLKKVPEKAPEPPKVEEKAPEPPPVVEEKPRPVRPKLEDPEIAGDWDELSAAEDKYFEDLTEWKVEQKDVAKAKKAEADRAAAKVEQDAKTAKTAEELERERFNADWNSKVQAGKAKHDDWDEVISSTNGKAELATPAMLAALPTFDDMGEILYYLAQHQDESAEIAKLTQHKDGLAPREYQALTLKAQLELLKIQQKIQTSASAPVTTPAKTPAAAPARSNSEEKPLATRAPAPPTPVVPRASGSSDPKEASSFEDYERKRLPTIKPRR